MDPITVKIIELLENRIKALEADRQQLIDRIMIGGGLYPIYSKPTAEPEEPEVEVSKPAGEQEVPTDLEYTVEQVGRDPRAVVNAITSRNLGSYERQAEITRMFGETNEEVERELEAKASD